MSFVDVELLEVQSKHKAALQRGTACLQSLLNVSIPEAWPQFPGAFELSGDEPPAAGTWPAYFFLCRSECCLVGNGGFAGSINADGEVEIGYEIAPRFQNRGFATAAARELLKYAFSHPQVRAVVAHTLAEANASNAVLRKVGMSFVAELPNQEVGSVWRWRIPRSP